MNVEIRSPRGNVVEPGAAEVAAIVVALRDALTPAPVLRPRAAKERSRWRAAGRTYDTYDAYESARARARAKPFA